MRQRVLSLAFVFAALLLFSRPAQARFCTTFELPGAAAIAQVVFSGEITKVERVDDPKLPVGDYFVTFRVETWWKGAPLREMRLLWRTSWMECGYLPVGEVGEKYLVYADDSVTSDDQPLEVTIFNRTSRMPANWEPEPFLLDGWTTKPRVNPKPTLNRRDASEDLKVLRVLLQCSCLSTNFASNPTMVESKRTYDSAACQTCLRSRLKYYW